MLPVAVAPTEEPIPEASEEAAAPAEAPKPKKPAKPRQPRKKLVGTETVTEAAEPTPKATETTGEALAPAPEAPETSPRSTTEE